MPHYLGVDAGGSKTECAVGDDHAILGRSTATSCKVQKVGEEAARTALQQGIREACKNAGVSPREITHSCIGIAGASDARTALIVHRIMRDTVGGEVDVIGDNVIALEAAFRTGPGVISIAGTGSIVFGRNERGDTARAGGWGPVISDEGSAEWIGRQAAAAAVRAVDTGQNTALTKAVLEAWHVATREDIVRLSNAYPHPDFAGLYPNVLHAALDGDSLARDLLMRAGTELAGLTKIVIRKLWPGRHAVRVCVAGGVFTTSAVVRQVYGNSLRAERPDIAVSFGHVHPVAGALAIARRAGGRESQPAQAGS
ncbi:MAG TPA: BadF/BadG/BcrA/BcrD ATPase family protein [Terriglobales bacterium]|jgi:N-acetylglucosamine kinase-like BadF-type ATPase|nr:BadF/BadG/BcrA/BcrD ATPase family protein [Terriglobales bacterium]